MRGVDWVVLALIVCVTIYKMWDAWLNRGHR